MKRVWRWIGIALSIALVAIGTLAVVGYREAVGDPVARTARMGLPDWPMGAAPVRVALLSDIHIGGLAMDETRLARIVAQVNARRPDLVLIAGDFVVGHDPVSGKGLTQRLIVPLSRLRAPLGVIAVPGNHDHWTGVSALIRAMNAAGATTLVNRATRRGPLTVIGIDDAFSGHADVRAAFASAEALGGTSLVLTHSPDVIGTLPRGRPPLCWRDIRIVDRSCCRRGAGWSRRAPSAALGSTIRAIGAG